MVRIHALWVINFILTHSSINWPKNRAKNEELMKMRFFRRYLMTVANGLGNAEKANFREIGVLKRHSKLELFLLLLLLAIFFCFSSFFFSKNLEYNFEEVDLGSRTLFSLVNVQGFWHKLWPV